MLRSEATDLQSAAIPILLTLPGEGMAGLSPAFPGATRRVILSRHTTSPDADVSTPARRLSTSIGVEVRVDVVVVEREVHRLVEDGGVRGKTPELVLVDQAVI